MTLTDAQVRGLKPGPTRYSVGDGGGLRLEVMETGSKFWRQAYRLDGRQRRVTLGEYPEVKLAVARAMREDVKRKARLGVDPNPRATERAEARAATEAGIRRPVDDLFRDVSDRWTRKRIAEEASPITIAKYHSRLRRPLLRFGEAPVGKIAARDILDMLREIEALKQYETAKRVRTLMSQIFTFAIAEGIAESDPTLGLERALISAPARHHAGATDPTQVGWLMRLIKGYTGQPQTRAALLLSAYCALRPGETRGGRWDEIDWADSLWRIPGHRMKGTNSRDHIVPLSTQVISVLEWLRPWTGRGELILPASTNPGRALSSMTMNQALTNLGVPKSVHVPHGFRTTFSTNLNEAMWNRDWVEVQLHHVHGDKVRGAYNSAQYLEARRVMMQVYADWLDGMAALPEGERCGRDLLRPPEGLRGAA